VFVTVALKLKERIKPFATFGFETNGHQHKSHAFQPLTVGFEVKAKSKHRFEISRSSLQMKTLVSSLLSCSTKRSKARNVFNFLDLLQKVCYKTAIDFHAISNAKKLNNTCFKKCTQSSELDFVLLTVCFTSTKFLLVSFFFNLKAIVSSTETLLQFCFATFKCWIQR
jgi:hypothetical protein